MTSAVEFSRAIEGRRQRVEPIAEKREKAVGDADVIAGDGLTKEPAVDGHGK